MKSSKEIRQMWIDFFVSKKHFFIESKSLIPYNDPSLLWINSGVATLKDFFSGKKKPPAPRLVNSQKAIRTNDIENVGITARHHTFFEMLGNFSIGDYFKNEAIEFGHEFVTQVLKLDQNKIYITYFEEDLLVRDKWLALGYKPEQLIAGSKDLNFWDVGSGPCGPNTEIFYDRGPKYHSGGPELIANDIENDRFIEIWNIVFSELNNNGDGTYTELAQKNIDTGAGLERIVSIMQDGPTNFDTDLFLPIIHKIEDLSGSKYQIDNYFKNDPKQNMINKHFKIIADHMRAVTNAIGDGEKPSNTQRGYIIRRLIRRAYYSGTQLGIKEKTFLHQLVKIVKDSLIFDINVEKVARIIEQEELVFSTTIDQGKKILNQNLVQSKSKAFDVNVAFKLYETFGFPIEMTNDLLIEQGLTLDFEKLQSLKDEHAQKSKSNQSVANFAKQINSLELIKTQVSKFIGYDHLKKEDAKILFLLNDQTEIKKSKEADISYLILDETPFYATSGGQLHDQGYLVQKSNQIELLDVFKDKYHNNVHVVRGKINSKQPIKCYVNPEIRLGLMRNHSATHLTFAALRHVYGKEIEQLGSDNNQNRLLFDFPLDHKPTIEEIEKIEAFVHDVIKQNVQRNYLETTIEEAKKMNAIMTIAEAEYFDSNYIRIVEFPGITADLCGGTHIDWTKNLEAFKITNVDSKGTGIFRIRAITSHKLVNQYYQEEIMKYRNLYDNLFKKYQQLYETKLTDEDQFQLNLEPNLALKTILEQYKKAIDIVTNKTKQLLKLPNKINQEINFVEVQQGNYQFLVALNVDKNLLKDLAIKTREANPDQVIVVASKFENNQLAAVISSKNHDISLLIKSEIFNQFDIKGGGNQLIWQGVFKKQFKISPLGFEPVE